MPLPAEAALRRMEQNLRRLRPLTRALLVAIPLAALATAADLARWWTVELQVQAAPSPPDLQPLRKPLEPLPEFVLTSQQFPSIQSPVAAPTAMERSPEVGAKEIPWKLRGLVMRPNRRAFLEDEKAQRGVWVTEGEMVEGAVVKKIGEGSVVLEADGKSYELRM